MTQEALTPPWTAAKDVPAPVGPKLRRTSQAKEEPAVPTAHTPAEEKHPKTQHRAGAKSSTKRKREMNLKAGEHKNVQIPPTEGYKTTKPGSRAVKKGKGTMHGAAVKSTVPKKRAK